MTDGTSGPDQQPVERRDQQPEPGRIAVTHPGSVVACIVVGLVGGWLVRPIFVSFDRSAPIVTWVQVSATFLIAALLALVARHTWRAVQVRRVPLPPHIAVNRLVMAKACLLVGAVVVGGYVGYAVSWIGLSAELAGQRMFRSALAAVGGLLIAVSAALLERACRVPADPEAD